MTRKSGIEILLDDRRGVYIPHDFAECFDMQEWGVSPDDVAILLAGPEHPEYWDAWNDVERDATFTDSKGNIWRLYQDGDLFAICEELLTDEERANMGWDED